MRKQGLLILLILTLFAGIFSCSKEEFTDKDANAHQDKLDSIAQVRDSLEKIGGIIEYSVNVVMANGSGWLTKDAKGITGATVTVSQHGRAVSKVTGSGGIAVFSDMRIGTVNVNIKAPGYTDVDYVALLAPEYDLDIRIWYGIKRFAATMVPVFSLATEHMSTIKGMVTYEADLTNMAPEVVSGVEVIATIDVTNSAFYDTYISGMPYSTGLITQISFGSVGFRGTTDAQGLYTISVPSTGNGLPYKIDISDVTANQNLLLNNLNGIQVWGVQSVRTIYSSSSSISATTLPNPAPLAAYVTFSPPTGNPQLAPDQAATAAANITESGIVSINIVNKGEGYTQVPIIKISDPGNIHYGQTAEAEAAITNGKVTAINITNPGSGYAPNSTPTVTIIDKEGDNASAEAFFTYSIYDIEVDNSGSGYETRPNVTIVSGAGSGASAEAVMSGYIKKFEVTDMGAGYICPPTVVVKASDEGGNARGSAVMTEFNPIHSIVLSENYKETNFFEITPVVEIVNGVGGTGSGATAVAQLASKGRVSRIEIINGGFGYAEAPTVTVLGDGNGAAAWATIDADGIVTSITLESNGYNYTAIPTIQISAPPAGGVQATAEAFIEKPIASIALTNPGSGYNISYSSPTSYSNQPSVLIDGSTLTANDDVWVRPNMSVDKVIVTNPGGRYQAVPTVTLVPNCGVGGGATAIAHLRYSVESIKVIEEGAGYEYWLTANVMIDKPTDEGTTAAATAYKGRAKLSHIKLNEGGTHYTAAPNVRILWGGTNAGPVITGLVSGGSVTGFNINNNVIDDLYHTFAPHNFTLSISTKLGAATASAQANPESGKIQFVDVTNPGRGYAVAPVVRFLRVNNLGQVVDNQDNASFVNAEATAHLVDGRVATIEVTNPGSGYYYAPKVELVMQTEVRVAKGTPVINTDGNITAITLTDAGNGYVEAPSVTINASVPGLGSGATAITVLSGTTPSTIGKVIMTNNGAGYLGKNRPTTAQAFAIKPAGNTLTATSGKTYVKDFYMGTGMRTVDSN